MQPVITLQYGEYLVVDKLSKEFKGKSVFVPSSSQQKGIDLMLYDEHSNKKFLTIQVKSSKSHIDYDYAHNKKRGKYLFNWWFPNFNTYESADLFLLCGIFPKFENLADGTINLKSKQLELQILVFKYQEMKGILENARQKKNPNKYDDLGFGFSNNNEIFLTRGCSEVQDFSKYLFKNRKKMILEMFNE